MNNYSVVSSHCVASIHVSLALYPSRYKYSNPAEKPIFQNQIKQFDLKPGQAWQWPWS